MENWKTNGTFNESNKLHGIFHSIKDSKLEAQSLKALKSKQKNKENKRRYYRDNKEKCKQISKKYYNDNKEKQKKVYRENKSKYL